MVCAWEALLSILPRRLKSEVDRLGRDTMQELRLRMDAPAQMVFQNKSCWLPGRVTREELKEVINSASRYSPWAATGVSQGYITAPGGHRIGLCGEVVFKNGRVEGIREITSLCIRVARDFPGIAGRADSLYGSILIIGPPGWGKTTLLRDLVRRISRKEMIGVVDQRGELFPIGFDRGECTDVLTGCPKPEGIHMLLRTMGPRCIAVDEITEDADVRAILQAANCGVRLLATAHASCPADLRKRMVYRQLVENHIFDSVITLTKDRSYRIEGAIPCQ